MVINGEKIIGNNVLKITSDNANIKSVEDDYLFIDFVVGIEKANFIFTVANPGISSNTFNISIQYLKNSASLTEKPKNWGHSIDSSLVKLKFEDYNGAVYGGIVKDTVNPTVYIAVTDNVDSVVMKYSSGYLTWDSSPKSEVLIDTNVLTKNIKCDDITAGGDVSIGGSLTVPSDKGIEVGELTGSSIDIGAMTGGVINVGSIARGSINISAITGGSLNCKVSEIGNAATFLQKGCLYYVPEQSFDLPVSDYTSGSSKISGFILYYSGESWQWEKWFYKIQISSSASDYYYLAVNQNRLVVKILGANPTSYEDWVKYYKLPITITFKNPED